MIQGSLNKADSTNAASGLYSFQSRGSSWVHSLVSFFYSGIGAAAIPARLRLRKNFGERAFSPGAVLISISFYIFICSKILFFLLDNEDDDYLVVVGMFLFLIFPFNYFTIFIYKTLITAYTHFKNIYSHSEDKKYKYSFFRGEPIEIQYLDKIGSTFFGHKVDEKLIRMYFEPKGFLISHLKKMGFSLILTIPAVLLAFGFFSIDLLSLNISGFIFGFFAFWLVTYSLANFCLAFSGLCLLIEEFLIAQKIRETVLDMVDGQYDMKFIMEQKELLSSDENNNTDSLDIAESIFQNSNTVDMASFDDFLEDKIEENSNLIESKEVLEKPLGSKPKTNTKKQDKANNEIMENKELDDFMSKIME